MIGEALRLIRVFHDVKQNEMAARFGVSKSYLSEIERGGKEPSLSLIQKYSNEFKIPVSSIMFFSESLDGSVSYRKAKSFVAEKILRMLKFIEERSETDESH